MLDKRTLEILRGIDVKIFMSRPNWWIDKPKLANRSAHVGVTELRLVHKSANDSFGLLTNKQQNNIVEKDFISSIVCSSVTDNPAHVHCSAKETMNAIRGMLCERSAVRP